MKCVILKGYLDLWILNSGMFTCEWKDNIDTNGALVMARNHWIIFFNPIASPHGLVCFILSSFILFSLSFLFFLFVLFFILSKPATDESTWVLLGFYPEKDGAQTDPCMSDVGHTVHGAGLPASVWHHCSPCLPTGGVVGD